MNNDHAYMAEALRWAALGRYSAHPNPVVGCLLVRDGRVVGRGAHWRAGTPHAEVHALQQAGPAARGATAYVTLEPCAHHGRTPPCTDALIAAGVARVVFALRDPNPLVAGQGGARLAAAGIQVTEGVLAEAARELNIGFLHRMETGRPWVRVKLAASMDGRTAMASGESQWITGPAARRDGQRLRARAGAILTGSGTVLRDDPRLTVRESVAELLSADGVPTSAHPEIADLPVPAPLRVVVDSRLQTPPTAQVLGPGTQVLILTSPQQAKSQAAEILRAQGAEVQSLPQGAAGYLDLHEVMALLGRCQVNEVHVEAGARLAGTLADAGLVDEWVFYLAPCLLGASARPLISSDLTAMADRRPLDILSCDRVGADLRIRARPSKAVLPQ